MTTLYASITMVSVFMRYNISVSQPSTNLKQIPKAMKQFTKHL